jgi:hypothetical protein
VSIKVEDSAFDVDSVLDKLGYDYQQKSKVKESEVLLLPDNIEASESYFDDKSISIKKEIEKKLRLEVLTKQGAKSHYQAQRAADIVLPLLVFFGYQAFDIGKGIIASWIYDKYIQLRYRNLVPNARFKFIIIDDKKKTRKELSFEGPADTASKILKDFKT